MEAHRDAALVFKAASEGRPLELAKRLRLGKLAGGHHRKGYLLAGDSGDNGECVTALEAAVRGGHVECEALLKDQGADLGT